MKMKRRFHVALIATAVLLVPAAAKTFAHGKIEKITRAQMSRDVINAIRQQRLEGSDAANVLDALQHHVEIAEECMEANRLIVAFQGEEAFIFLVVDEKPCAVVAAPAEAVRTLILHVLGQPT
jgi:hypothetical protein